ncbi:unnamed protein product [Trifolium pratense]|uniref:Uncharacterized protein n=1 Tax=Trifolium pratense TaxID=57577 RepID=A0ACB0KNN7_TRIPR|nr:unnamed protein product [Trifolium pratense]
MKLQSLSQSFNISFTDSIYQFEAVDISYLIRCWQFRFVHGYHKSGDLLYLFSLVVPVLHAVMNHDYRFSCRSKPSIPVPLAVSVVKLSLTVISVCINGIMQASSDFCRHVELHCGYLFGLPVGIVADSVGATVGAVAAFLLGGTVSQKKKLSVNGYKDLMPDLTWKLMQR